MSFFRNIKIRYLFLLLLLPINILTSVIYTVYYYKNDKALIIKGIDDKLITAAYGLKFFEDSYHDKITDNASISREQYIKVIKKLGGFSDSTKIEAAYSMVVRDGKIFFTSDSATSDTEDFKATAPVQFFEQYKDASKGLLAAVKENKIHFDDYSDKWGNHRSIFLPTTSLTGKQYIIGIDVTLGSVDKRLNKALFDSIAMGLAVFTFGAALTFIFAWGISKNLNVISSSFREVANGNFDIVLPPVWLGQEVATLTDSFEHMQISLKDYIKKLTETVKERQRIESDLNIAHDIQMGILPKIFPPFPDRIDEFDIFAIMEPAKEVGGDLYDFFFIDKDMVFFSIGDVSGKGVAASLFMAITKTIVKSTAIAGRTTGEILTKVNHDLSSDNDAVMFVTFFACILNLRTGELQYTNCGHNPPVIIDENGYSSFFPFSDTIPLGVQDGFIYSTGKMYLKPQSMVFLYTDGVTEAQNTNNDMYDTDRLIAQLNENKSKTIKDIVNAIKQDVFDFSDGALQYDDITMLAVRFFGEKTVSKATPQ